ncbi:hypothetical protein QYE80_03495 [Pseudomonas tohonis]|nr:hypothetical protein [Pseudomonas tohonis]
MIEIFSRLSFESESLDAAFYRPRDPADVSLASKLNNLAAQGEFNFSFQISDEFDERIELPTLDDLSNFKIELVAFNKARTKENKYFFSIQGFLKNLGSSEIAESKNIYIHENFSEFRTLTCNLQKWDLLKKNAQEDRKSIDLANPRKIIKDYTGSQINPNHLFWITPCDSDISDDLFAKWLDIATPRASMLLVSEISTTDTNKYYSIKGSKTLEFLHDNQTIAISRDEHYSIHDALHWIFETSREAEIRHTLLCQRLSHNDPKKNENWIRYISRTIKPALSNSREDYKNHLLVKTGELLKAITDIRKTVSDETNKIVDKTSALTSSLLRDASITFMIATLRQTLIAKNIITRESASFLLIATVAWLAISILLTGYQNKIFIHTLIRFRRSWSKGLSSLVPESELKKISRRPIREAIANYGRIKKIIDLIYATLILIIVSILLFG